MNEKLKSVNGLNEVEIRELFSGIESVFYQIFELRNIFMKLSIFHGFFIFHSIF